jgi:hypothetical protein
MEDLHGIPQDPFPSGAGALLTNGVPDRSAPSAPKPRSPEPTAGKSAPAKQHSHASSNVSILIKSSLCTQNYFIYMARSWRSRPAVTERFQRPYSLTHVQTALRSMPKPEPRTAKLASIVLDGQNLRTNTFEIAQPVSQG